MGDLEHGVCGICGKQNVRVHRKYYNYPDVKCECHSPHHFDLVLHCDDCEPKQPTYTRIQVRTDTLRMEKRDWGMALSVLNSLEISISENTPHNLIGIALAKEAVQKQIPKEPIKKNPIVYQREKDGKEYYAYDYHCPLCDKKVLYHDFHCLCGQRITWKNITIPFKGVSV